MLGGPVEGSVNILRQLKDEGRNEIVCTHQLECGAVSCCFAKYDFLHWFDGRVVSGEEKMRKPTKQFYHILLDRYHLQPQEVFLLMIT